MEEKKLTAEEIVKKLNYIKEQYLSYIYNDDDECKVLFVDDILDLINRLQTENAEQKKELARLKKFELYRIDEMKKQKAEIERLTEENEHLDMVAKQALADYQNAQVEVDELKVELQGQFNKGVNCGFRMRKFQKSTVIKQAVKDTAKEIYGRVLELIPIWGGYQKFIDDFEGWLKEHYGVEVE